MRIYQGTLALLAMLGLACASTQVATQWSDKATSEPPPKKLLVVAQVPTQAVRHRLENDLALELKSRGFTAVPMTRLSSNPKSSKDDVNRVHKEGTCDGLVVSRYIETTQGYAYGGYPYAGGWWGYPYADAWDVQESMVVETNLFDLQNKGRLRWSATSATQANAAYGTVISDRDISHYAKVIAGRLQQDIGG